MLFHVRLLAVCTPFLATLLCISPSLHAAEQAEDQTPTVSADVVQTPAALASVFTASPIEFHGRYNNDDFWARLLPADTRYGGGRILELLYTPHNADALAGAQLIDHPQLFIDQHLRVIAWKEGRGEHQTGFGSVLYRGDMQPARYTIIRDVADAEGEPSEERRAIMGLAASDRHLLPILLACGYAVTDNTVAPFDMSVVDFFGGDHRQRLTAHVQTGSCTFGDQVWIITHDADGHIRSIHTKEGTEVLSITSFTKR